MFATNVDNADLVSITGVSYSEGIHVITAQTLATALGGILAAFCVVPAIYRAGMYTNAEYLEARFGPATRVLSALIQIQYRTTLLGLMMVSVLLLLTGMVGLEPVAAWLIIVGLVILAAGYTTWGGLKSVVVTDALQGLIIMIGAAVILTTVWNEVGGISGMREKLATADARAIQTDASAATTLSGQQPAADLPHISRYYGDDGRTPPYIIVIGWMIVVSGYWTVNHTQTMRMMGSRTLWDMKMAAVFGTAISIPLMVGCVALGLFGRALFPAFEKPDQLYPHMADIFLGPGLKGLIVAAIVAAAVSTFDSLGSALSAVFTRDIYARLIVRDANDAHYVRAGRVATVVILALGFAWVPFIMAKGTLVNAFLTLVPVFVTPLFTIYLFGVLTRVHRKSAIAGLTCGAVYGMIALLDREVRDTAWIPTWFSGKWPAFCWSMSLTGLAMIAVTLWLGRQPADDRLRLEQTGWLARSREALPVLREHPFAEQVPWLLRPHYLASALLAVTAYLVFGVFW